MATPKHTVHHCRCAHCRCAHCRTVRRLTYAALRKRMECEHCWTTWDQYGLRVNRKKGVKIEALLWCRSCIRCQYIENFETDVDGTVDDCPHVEVIGLRL